MTIIALPDAGGGWREIALAEPTQWAAHPAPFRSRWIFDVELLEIVKK